ncbi:MAG TPA: DM13 domain-containing protein [Solirubrobacteraceae bacterium]|nr:DM13 domain-containing protein [Solirubrobacteraceae bacterium]
MTNGETSILRRAASAAGLLMLAASFVIAADLFGARAALFGSATPPPRESAFSRVDTAGATTTRSVLRSQPWWQQVGRYRGTGPSAPDLFRISDGAIQWRVTWSCQKGRFVVRAPADPRPLVDEPCAGRGSKGLTKRPSGGLQVRADGPWTLRVEQQVDVPLVEPPLPAMSAPGTRTVATGGFYRIDQVGRGRVTIYRLANGRHALRLRDFYVTPNIDLEIRFHPLRKPRTTRQYLSAPARFVAPLDVTTGSMNFLVPAGVDPRRYRSVVIWCPLITSAYAAATLDHRPPIA